MSARLKITFLQQTNDPSSKIIATFGVHIISMDLYFGKVRLIRKGDGALFVAPPSEPYQDKQTGEKKYSNFWWFGKKSAKFFQDECIKAIRLYCEENNISGLVSPP